MKEFWIAVVDDDVNIRQLVEAYLHREGYRTIGLSTAEEAWDLWQTAPPDLWVLDIMLPGMDGYEFCRRIRSDTEVPIIMISARDEEVDKILGLELGSDDYLTKPFSPRELVARVKRILHRTRSLQQTNGSLPSPKKPWLANLEIQQDEHRVFWQAQEIELTTKEYQLLEYLVAWPNRAFTREELLTYVWGADYFGSNRAVDDIVKRLRKKLTNLPLESIWGFGYRLRVEGEVTP